VYVCIYGEGDLCGKTDTAQTPIADLRLIITSAHVNEPFCRGGCDAEEQDDEHRGQPRFTKFEEA
jgi:hypothetical protein